jgi:hypothetical protein
MAAHKLVHTSLIVCLFLFGMAPANAGSAWPMGIAVYLVKPFSARPCRAGGEHRQDAGVPRREPACFVFAFLAILLFVTRGCSIEPRLDVSHLLAGLMIVASFASFIRIHLAVLNIFAAQAILLSMR